MNRHSTSSLLSFKWFQCDNQERSYEAINGEQYNYYNTYVLKPLRGIFQLWVGCHIQPNTIEYTVDYSKQNETGFRFIG